MAAAALLLAACASQPPAPVEDRSGGAVPGWREAARDERAGPRAHVVMSGDTLYGIAFKNGLDFRDLARWNGIAPPYTIFVGQRLRLDGPAAPPADAPPEPRAATAVVGAERAGGPRGSAAPATARDPGLAEEIAAEERSRAGNRGAPSTATAAPPRDARTAAQAPVGTNDRARGGNPPDAPAAASMAAAGAAAREVPAAERTAVAPPAPTPAAAPPGPAAAAPAPAPAASLSSGGVSWRWPASGKLIGTYQAGDPTRQGIDIAGRAGDAVYAAADGTVVYSGNGLIGYGELIIVKHNASFLSAYGHNRKRLVKEGDAVKAGQAIAEMGDIAVNREGLHFEIRRNGKPSNPLDFLPAR